MGKKRIIKKTGQKPDKSLKSRALARAPKRKIAKGILNIQATYNNTMACLTDMDGNVVMSSSSGALGFKGAKKSTPFAAAKVGEILGERAVMLGLKDVSVVVKGVGSGRESVIRSFIAHNIEISSIVDKTPVPHNGVRPKKARRV